MFLRVKNFFLSSVLFFVFSSFVYGNCYENCSIGALIGNEDHSNYNSLSQATNSMLCEGSTYYSSCSVELVVNPSDYTHYILTVVVYDSSNMPDLGFLAPFSVDVDLSCSCTGKTHYLGYLVSHRVIQSNGANRYTLYAVHGSDSFMTLKRTVSGYNYSYEYSYNDLNCPDLGAPASFIPSLSVLGSYIHSGGMDTFTPLYNADSTIDYKVEVLENNLLPYDKMAYGQFFAKSCGIKDYYYKFFLWPSCLSGESPLVWKFQLIYYDYQGEKKTAYPWWKLYEVGNETPLDITTSVSGVFEVNGSSLDAQKSYKVVADHYYNQSEYWRFEFLFAGSTKPPCGGSFVDGLGSTGKETGTNKKGLGLTSKGVGGYEKIFH